MFKTPEFKVGLLIVIVTGLIASLTLKVSDGPGMFTTQKHLWFVLENSTGLVPNSAVRMAGIRVGKIDRIRLQEGKARVEIAIDTKLSFTKQGYVNIRAQGLLGDKVVELYPGPVGAEELPSGSQVLKVIDNGAIDEVVSDVGKISKSLGELADIITNASKGNGDANTPIGRIILNIEKATKDLASVTAANRDKVSDVMDSLLEITGTLDDIINGKGENGFRPAWSKAVDSLDKLNSAMGNLSEASQKLNNGQGTLGRLINDDEVLQKVETTMDSVNEFLGNTSDLETSIGYHAEHIPDNGGFTKSYLDIKIQPGLDRYYLIQIISDPLGSQTADRTDTVDGIPTTTTTLDRKALKYSIQFAKNFYNFTVRGGVIESSGGLGFDYFWLRKKLRWSTELYSFDDMKVKSYVKYDIWKGIYVIAGGDDLSDAANTNTFLGAGLFITNEDLKTFASKVSF